VVIRLESTVASSMRSMQCPFGALRWQHLALQIISFKLLESQQDEMEMEKQKQSECSISMSCVHIPQLISFLGQIFTGLLKGTIFCGQ